MGMTLLRKAKRRTRGMAMVEMVFVLPLLLLLVFAIAQFGLMFSRWLTLSNAVREGARNGVAFRGLLCPGDKTDIEDEVRDAVVTYANAGGVPIGTGDVTVTGICDPSGDPVDVSASYDFDLKIPFATFSTIPISYSSSMRNE